jgi:uncharacterized protein (DUF433 family)
MLMKLIGGQVYDSVVVEYVIVNYIEEGLTDQQILADFAEE